MNLLFYTPHAALWPHTAPEAYLARALHKFGHKIAYLTCGKAHSYCAPMTAQSISPGCTNEASERVCSRCKAGATAIARVYRFPVDTLSRYLSKNDLAKIENIATDAVASKSLDTEYLGIRVGRLALYEFTLAHKKMSTELNESQWKEYQVYLNNALRSLLGFAKYLKNNSHDAIVTFSPQYSNINSAMQYAVSQGIKVLFIESGTNLAHRLGTMRVWDWRIHGLVNPALSHWERSELNPVTAHSASMVTRHFSQLLSGRHFAVYSPTYTGGNGVRKRWNIQPRQKVVLMTLSSYDEAYAASLINGFPSKKVFSDIFPTQAEWLKATVEWVAKRPDLFLVIRVHPRDFPNKRDNVRSEQSYALEDLLKQVPVNAHVNWPNENVSLYELLEDSDVIVTGWSVTAMEALVLGIPVVTYDANLPSYPSDIHYTGRSESEYFENIDKALSDGWSFENAVNGFRWLAYNFVTCTVTVSDKFGDFELGKGLKISTLRRLWERAKLPLPVLSCSLDLLDWKDAIPGAYLVSEMLKQGYDSLPPTRKALGETNTGDDRRIVAESLSRLHNLLYAKSNLPDEKPGLSRNIRYQLAQEGCL